MGGVGRGVGHAPARTRRRLGVPGSGYDDRAQPTVGGRLGEPRGKQRGARRAVVEDEELAGLWTGDQDVEVTPVGRADDGRGQPCWSAGSRVRLMELMQ